MRTTATILVAGLTAAALLSLPEAATSQSFQPQSVHNDQTQSGDVIADGQLNVVDAESVSASANAMGNGYAAATQSGSLNVASGQDLQGNVSATNHLDGSGTVGAITLSTTATGNTGDSNSLGYGDLTANVAQHVGAVQVEAVDRFHAATGSVDTASDSVQAIGNSHGFATVGGSADATVTQAHEGVTQADAGNEIGYVSTSGAFSATAVSNNVSIVGTSGTTSSYRINQSMAGNRTQAAYFTEDGSAQQTDTTTSAVANNISGSNENNPLTVSAAQTNQGYLRSQAYGGVYEFGGANVTANGVGNSSVLGANGADVSVDISQTNSGGVEVLSTFSGDHGYDANSTAVAMGNASTAYACSTCQSKMSVSSRQVNTNGVSASSQVTMTGGGRNLTSAATAVGNSATYYVSAPGN